MFTDFGIGVGLRFPHYDQFLKGKPSSVSWAEVISENFMDWNDRPNDWSIHTLEKIRAHIPIALHGVSLSIGSVDPLDVSYLKRLKALAKRIEPIWISDHLCWTGVNGQNMHDLLPLPYTEEALNLVVPKIKQVQDILGRRMVLENVSSYLEFEQSEMTEWEFLAEVAEQSDCGILLDINNIYVSSINHSFNPLKYLLNVPKPRVAQMHLAGHTNKGKYLIDTHDAPVCEEVWKLYRWAVKHFGYVSTMIERDSNIPHWDILEAELYQASRIREEVKNEHSRVSSEAVYESYNR